MLKARDFSRNYLKQDKLGVSLSDTQIKMIQEISLGMYKDILEMCGRNNMTVMLGGGTALGAVRHDGFIPWDDDMDLMMFRKDFDRFIRLFEENLGHKYKIKAPGRKGYDAELFIQVINPDAQKMGIFHDPKSPTDGIPIDIFCIDYLPGNRVLFLLKGFFANILVFGRTSKRMFRGRTKLSKEIYCQSITATIYYYFRLFIGLLCSPISDASLCSFFDKIVRGKQHNHMTCIPAGRKHYFGEIHPVDVFFPVRKILFEKTEAYVPNQVEEYLKNLYGENYMQIPPIEKRENHIYTFLKL